MAVTITSALRVGLVSGTGVTFNAPVVPFITTDDIFLPDNPTETLTEVIDGISSSRLLAVGSIDGTTVGNTAMYTVPAGDVVFPTSVLFALTDISGSGNPPAINLGTSGSFQEIIDNTRSTTYELAGGAPFAAGTGYLVGDTLTLSGGTHATTATLTVDTIKLVSVGVNAAGTIYAPADTVTLAGGTSTVKGIVTVQTVKLVSATIAAGGTGYGNTQTFNATVVGGTHSVTAVVSVTSDVSGVVTTVNSVGTAGSYTVLPTLSANAVTGGTGTGLTLDLVFGINTISITTAGDYTVGSTTFTQFATGGSGSGATFNAGVFGVNEVEVDVAGDYSVLPSNHVAVTGGAGTSFTYDADWSVLSSLFSSLDLERQILSVTDFTETAGTDGDDYMYITAASPITLRVAVASTYTTYTLKVYVFGFQVEAP